ncbi:uncharacterized protein CDAR_173911 [Caerostris darwini]|uniref:Uncharacterized protein n=1 Tax=Caerostris darwini TaxID=1538125 RepID=A0AAV4NVX2_9ARAC|nr:uncharacterized protein CDAR_173911 [Caerostris darwini]
MDENMEINESTISRLKQIIQDRDSDIEKAALFGQQLLEDKNKLSLKLDELISENEFLKQERYSIKLNLETQLQTVNTQSSELTDQRDEFDKLAKKFQVQQNENTQQQQQISNLKNEKYDLEKSVEDFKNENNTLKKRVVRLEQQTKTLQNKAEESFNMTIMEEDKIEEHNLQYYKLKTTQLEKILSDIQYELENSKLEESRLLALVAKLEEDVIDRDKELKSYSVEVQKARDVNCELQGEIEILKLEQIDVNRRGNSVFGELDDRRKLVEKEYKLLAHKYQNMLKNFEEMRSDLTSTKGQMALLLSMTSRQYQESYINRLQEQLTAAKSEVKELTAKLNRCTKLLQQEKRDHLPYQNDAYDFLRAMHQDAQEKIKRLQDDVMSVRVKNIDANENLTCTHYFLYIIQEELDAVKLENRKLKEELRILKAKPDEGSPKKEEPNVEILPWYKGNIEKQEGASSNEVNDENKKVSYEEEKENRLQKIDPQQLKVIKTALKQVNRTNEEVLEEISKECEIEAENRGTPLGKKVKYKPLAHRKNDQGCAQQ